jgi:hypothetical protein
VTKCASNSTQEKQQKENIQLPDSSKANEPQATINSKDSLGKLFDNKKPFEILSLVKGLSSMSTDDDTSKCTKWKLTKNQIEQIIKHSNAINGTELDLAFENLACILTGQLLQGEEKFNYNLNAGSWMYISCRDTTLIFGNDVKADRKYFLSPPYAE